MARFTSVDSLRFEPMDQEYFESFTSLLEDEYTAEQVAAGSWNAETAAEQYRAQRDQLLPQGLESPGVHLLVAYDGPLRIGHVWLAPAPSSEEGHYWIFHILIDESLRGHGYGRRLLQATEEYAKSLDAVSIGLNVFGTNKVARSLYESSGYEVLAQRMRKFL